MVIRSLVLFIFFISSPVAADMIDTKADKQIIKLTSRGLEPSTLSVSKGDATVFFYNDTGKPIEKFSIKFGKNRIHCHNPSLALESDGYLRNVQPIVPNSFVLACFPDSDSYSIETRINDKNFSGAVVVPGEGKGN